MGIDTVFTFQPNNLPDSGSIIFQDRPDLPGITGRLKNGHNLFIEAPTTQDKISIRSAEFHLPSQVTVHREDVELNK